jgi:hypothetical protein
MKFFHAVKRLQGDFNMKIVDLVKWLHTYVDVLFPENGIEYWDEDLSSGPLNYVRSNQVLTPLGNVPTAGTSDNSVHHIACYVREGSNEGEIIEVSLYLRNGKLLNLTWIKSFGSEEECWSIARAIAKSLSSFIFYYEEPELVSMAQKLPKDYPWYRQTNLKEQVLVEFSDHMVCVKTESGQIIDQRDFGATTPGVQYAVQSYVQDWQMVLTNMRARYAISENALQSA